MPIKDNRGVALVLVLVVIALLVSLVVDFTYTMQVDMTLAANQRDEIKALYTARSGVELARLTLQDDDNEYDAGDEDWALFDGLPGYIAEDDEGRFHGTITDEESKFPIHALVNDQGLVVPARLEQLERLFILLDIDLELIDPIVDWLDPDDTAGPSGAEDAYYEGLTPPYPCKDGPLASVEELLLVKGMTEAIFHGDDEREGLLQYFTIHSDGKININTASAVVLQCLSEEIDEGLAQVIIEYREEAPFQSVTEIKTIPGMNEAIYNEIKDRITIQSSTFSIRVEGEVRGITKGIYTVVKRHEKSVEPVFWRIE
jgi:general secretion pathway protein K